MTGCEQVRVFLRRCRRALASDCPELSLDLSEVRIADSKLLACLVLVRQAAERDRVGVNVTASSAVRNLIGIYRLGRLLGDCDSQPY